MGILSPLMKQIVDEEASYPSPSAKAKLNKAIGRYKLLEVGEKWHEYMDDIKFALADLLVARGEEEDNKTALKDYDFLIKKSKSNSIKGRAMIGKAELAISGVSKISVDEAIDLCKNGCKLLNGDLREFFVAKGIAVEAELLVKKSGLKNIKLATKLFDKLINKKAANSYFRGRAAVGKAELILYFGIDSVTKGIKLCEEALKILFDRPFDYFAAKAKLVEAEMLSRRGSSSDLEKAEELCKKVILTSASSRDLAARAKLIVAEISKKERAEKLFTEVLNDDGLDPYIIEKAKLLKNNFKNRIN